LAASKAASTSKAVSTGSMNDFKGSINSINGFKGSINSINSFKGSINSINSINIIVSTKAVSTNKRDLL